MMREVDHFRQEECVAGGGVSIISFLSFRFVAKSQIGRIPVMWSSVPVDLVHRNGSCQGNETPGRACRSSH
jgi:hypothetical protein